MTTNQFKAKCKYYVPFIMAWYFESHHCLYYHVSYVLDNGNKFFVFQQSPCFCPSNVVSVLFSRCDSVFYQSQLRRLKDFLIACNPRQFNYFLDLSQDFSNGRLLLSDWHDYLTFLRNLVGDCKFLELYILFN